MTAMRLKRYPSPSGGIALGKMGVGATMMRSWDVTYTERLTSPAFLLAFPGITVADLLSSKITAKLYQYTTNLGTPTVAFLRANSTGCEFQVQAIQGGWLKSALVSCIDGVGGVWARAGYLNTDSEGRYAHPSVGFPYDLVSGTFAGYSSYFAGEIHVVGPGAL